MKRIIASFFFTFIFCFFSYDLFGNDRELIVQEKISYDTQRLKVWDFSLWNVCNSDGTATQVSGKKKEEIADYLLWKKNGLKNDDCIIGNFEIDFLYFGNEQFGLLLPMAKRGLKISVNDKFLIETRPLNNKDISPHIVSKSDVVYIPENLLKQGQNKLTIKTSALDGFIGLMASPQIGPLEIIKKKYLYSHLWYGALAYILFFLSAYYLLHFYKRRNEKYYLYFSGFTFFSSLWILGFTGLGLFLADTQFTYIFCIYACGILLVPSNISFFHSFLKIPFGIIPKIINSIYFALVLVLFSEYAITGGVTFFNTYLYDPYISSILLLTFYLYYLTIRAIILKRPYARQILLGVIIYSISIFYSVLQFLGFSGMLFSIANQLLVEGIFFMALVFAWVLVSVFARVHTQLEEANRELLVLNKMKDEFLATTSHELRTPLHGIIGLSDAMLESSDKELSENQRMDVELIRSSARRLNSLVDEILDYSKLRAGKTDLYIGKVDLKQVIPSVVSITRGIIGKKNIQISFGIEPDLPVITGDRNRIEQILLNLLGNSVKFTEKGFITVTAKLEKEGVIVAIHDTGRGMHRSELNKIWNPYEQGHGSEHHSSGGVGLGLPITRHLVELHGGTISAESDRGKGSVFRVWLPIETPIGKTGIIQSNFKTSEMQLSIKTLPSADQPEFMVQSTFAAAESGELIMAIDDDPVNLQIIERLLSRKGYRIQTFQNGRDALTAISIECPQLILLDLMLPEMSGYDIILEIRKLYGKIFLPVIMITAKNQIEDMIKGFTFGCNDYLTKPFNHEELLVRVENQLVIKNIFDMDRGLLAEGDAPAYEVSLLKRSRLFKETVRTLKEWEGIICRDLEISKSFLDRLVGVRFNRPDFDIHVHFDPLLAIGGDLYLAHQLDDGRIRFFIADATGHGINASLNCINIMSEYNILRDNYCSPGEIIFTINNRFCKILKDQLILFSCCVVDIYPEQNRLVFASAGHPHQAVISPDGKINLMRPKGVIIGLSENIPYDNMEVSFPPEYILALFSDGLIENYNKSKMSRQHNHDEEFLYKLLIENRKSGSMEEMIEKTISSMMGSGRKKDVDNDDDTMLILIKHNP